MNICHTIICRLAIVLALCAPVPLLAQSQQCDAATCSQPCDSAATMPQFPGGVTAMMRFVADNLQLNPHAQVVGRVVVRFLVTSQGRVGDVEVLRSFSPEIDGELERVVRSFPQFTPAQCHGHPVDRWVTLPIHLCQQIDGQDSLQSE